MPNISQNLTVPGTLANGQVAQAADVVTLYNTFNAQNIPDTIGVFQQGLIDDTLTTLTIGGTVTKDWSFTVVKTKGILFVVSFSWASVTGTPALQFRVNAAAVTAATSMTAAGTGGGMVRWWIAPHDTTDVPRPSMVHIFDGTAQFTAQLNADLPNTDTTSIGVTFATATAGSLKLKYMRAWREG